MLSLICLQKAELVNPIFAYLMLTIMTIMSIISFIISYFNYQKYEKIIKKNNKKPKENFAKTRLSGQERDMIKEANKRGYAIRKKKKKHNLPNSLSTTNKPTSPKGEMPKFVDNKKDISSFPNTNNRLPRGP